MSMPTLVRACGLIAAGCFVGACLLAAAADLAGVGVRTLALSSAVAERAATGQALTAWLLLIGVGFALPGLGWTHAAPAANRRPWRSPLAVYPGAALAAALILAIMALAATRGGNVLPLLAYGVVAAFDAEATVMPIMVAMAAALLTGGRAPAAAAVLSAPLVMLSLLALYLDQSIMASAGAGALPFLVLAALFVPALIAHDDEASWRMVWPMGAVSLLPFAALASLGLLTPREIVSLALVPALAIGLVAHRLTRRDTLERAVQTAALEIGALVLAIAGCVASMLALKLLFPTAGGAMAALKPGATDGGLLLMAVVAIVLGAVVTPAVALIVLLPAAMAAITAGKAPAVMVVTLALAATLSLVVRLTRWRDATTAGAPDTVALPRTGGAIALLGGIAIIALVIWAPDILLTLAKLGD
jgi:hypothetical protein